MRRCVVLHAVAAALVMGTAGAAQASDPCSAPATTADVQFKLETKGHGRQLQAGEIIPLALTFAARLEKRYWADVRNYDRSGRLGIETYCVDGDSTDPLASYFGHLAGMLGGGLGTTQTLGSTPLKAEADLNEWRALAPGRHRVFAVSSRVWRAPDPGETSDARVHETVRSNTIEIEVRPPDPAWQSETLRTALKSFEGASTPEERCRAVRTVRFLQTEDSTRQLARLWARSPDQALGWELMFGLYGSPYRELAIESMRAELSAPDAAVSSEYLSAFVRLQVDSDSSWDPLVAAVPPDDFWQRRAVHLREVTKAAVETVVLALPRKTGKSRALTLDGILLAAGDDAVVQRVSLPALIASWTDLPGELQRQLIQYRWPLIAGPEMIPVLRRLLSEPPPAAPTDRSMARDAALRHLYALDPVAGRDAILADVRNPAAQPSPAVVALLAKEDTAALLPQVVERIARYQARDLDYALIARYGDGAFLVPEQAAFEKHAGKWACAPQTSMLRYFLRVAP